MNPFKSIDEKLDKEREDREELQRKISKVNSCPDRKPIHGLGGCAQKCSNKLRSRVGEDLRDCLKTECPVINS